MHDNNLFFQLFVFVFDSVSTRILLYRYHRMPIKILFLDVELFIINKKNIFS